jgi:integrase
MLTDAKIRSTKTGKLSDGRGLQVVCGPRGRVFYYRSAIGGAERLTRLGEWPELTLAAARNLAALEKAKRTNRPLPATSVTFGAIAAEFLSLQGTRVIAKHAQDSAARLAHLRALEHRPLAAIEPRDILIELRKLDRFPELQRRVLSLATQVFTLAVATGYTQINPAASLSIALPKGPAPTPHPAPTIAELRDLYRALVDKRCDLTVQPGTRLALAMLILTANRVGEVVGLRPEYIAADRITWPAGVMKGKHERMVPITPELRTVLDAARALRVEGNPYVFPGYGKGKKPMSGNALLLAWHRLLPESASVPHGVRAAFAGAAYASGKFTPMAIEAALAHQLDFSKVAEHYRRGAHDEAERLALAKWWVATVRGK